MRARSLEVMRPKVKVAVANLHEADAMLKVKHASLEHEGDLDLLDYAAMEAIGHAEDRKFAAKTGVADLMTTMDEINAPPPPPPPPPPPASSSSSPVRRRPRRS